MKHEDEQLALCLLEALYDLARANIPATPEMLAEWMEAPESKVQGLLTRLDAQALVDAPHCRLTMQGLVLALSIAGTRKLAKHAA
jgi:Mn-dependent DtxR family transcriptional regulator